MNARLQTLFTDAESLLDPESQEELADMLEAFLSNRTEDPGFTPEELEHLKRLSEEPFVPASPEEVAAFFRRGA